MRCGILWVTYGKDIEWFTASARSYKKFASGWEWAKCVVPFPDVETFKPHCDANGIHLVGFDEWPGKGFNHHQAMQCRGDEHFPDADVIFHIDSDCVFASPSAPKDWLPGGKVLLPFADFSVFLDRPVAPGEERSFMGFTAQKIDFNRAQYYWKFAADFALGFSVERETMQWMPIAHVREVYSKTREIIEARFGKTFDEYVNSCRSEYPQTFAEFNTLGGVAHKFFQERYHWQNAHVQGHAFGGRIAQAWSHGGLDRPGEYEKEVGGRQTPRQLFERLGLL